MPMPKYKIKHLIEYAFLKSIGGLVMMLPHRLALALGWKLAWITFHLLRWRRREAQRRIREVFGERYSEREVKHIAWTSIRNMFFNAIEIIRSRRMDKDWVEAHYNCEVPRDFLARHDPKEGAIYALPHTGNWDLAGVAAALLEIPVFFVTGTQHNPLFNRFANDLRGNSGAETIPRTDPGLLRKVIRNLKGGKVLAIVNDLRSRTPALPVPFLGKTANLAEGVPVFARMANVPVYPVILTRQGWDRHHWKIFDPIRPDPALPKRDDYLRMMRYVIEIFDREIQAHPEQFFWYNKRWVLDPLTDESDGHATGNGPVDPAGGDKA